MFLASAVLKGNHLPESMQSRGGGGGVDVTSVNAAIAMRLLSLYAFLVEFLPELVLFILAVYPTLF